MDPMSDMLSLLEARAVMAGGLRAGGRWAVRFPAPKQVKLLVIAEGTCLLLVEGERQSLRLERGDVFLLAAQRGFLIGSDLHTRAIPAARIYQGETDVIGRCPGPRAPGKCTMLDDEHDFLLLGSHVDLADPKGAHFTKALPRFIHVGASEPAAASMRWLIEELIRERAAERAGSAAAASHLVQLMMLKVLRLHFESERTRPAGWLRAAGDPELAPALRLMHGEPGRAWTLAELAKASAMSRSTFAVRFKEAAGVTPLAYLTDWRMRLAERALRDETTPVARLAETLGYGSESAFSHAFKRFAGTAPKRYRMESRRPSP